MYIALKQAGIKSSYEGETFVLINGFHFPNEVFERCANGKGEFKDRGGKRILPIKYTPDFIGQDFIIECKGRANDSFPMRWKLFKRLITEQFPNVTVYKPQCKKRMRRSSETNTRKTRQLAISGYKQRKIDKFIQWSIEVKGYIKYRDILDLHKEHEIVCLGKTDNEC